jgi:hypothetical protein
VRWRGLAISFLFAAAMAACSDSDGSMPSAEDTEELCQELKTMREESLAELGDGDPLDPNEYSSAVDDFYLRLREFVPPSVRDDIELVANAPGDDLRDAPEEIRDAAVRVGSYFNQQCGDHIPPR